MHLWIAQLTVFADNDLGFLSPCSNFHERVMSVFNAVLPEGPKIMVI